MAEIYTEPKEFKRYALVPAPPKWELQEYIVAFFKEKDNKYLAWFLHYYENTLNTNVQKYMKQFFMPEHFTDIKQAYIVGLLKALENYDISIGVPLLFTKNGMPSVRCLTTFAVSARDTRRRALRSLQSCVKLWQFGINTSEAIPTKCLK